MEDAGGFIKFSGVQTEVLNCPILWSGKCIPHTGVSWCDSTAVFVAERSTKTLREWIHTHVHGSLWRWSQFIHLGTDRSQTQNMGMNKALVGFAQQVQHRQKNKAFTHSDPPSRLQRRRLGELTPLLLMPAITHSGQVLSIKIFRCLTTLSTLVIWLDVWTSGGGLSLHGLTNWSCSSSLHSFPVCPLSSGLNTTHLTPT